MILHTLYNGNKPCCSSRLAGGVVSISHLLLRVEPLADTSNCPTFLDSAAAREVGYSNVVTCNGKPVSYSWLHEVY